MILKSKCAVFFSALVFVGSTFATQETPEPTVCPNVSLIQEAGLIGSLPMEPKTYMTYNIASYDTSMNWVFVMGPIHAKSGDIALKKGKKLLTTLSGSPSPEPNGHGEWACLYLTANPEVIAAAVLSDEAILPLTLRHYLKKS